MPTTTSSYYVCRGDVRGDCPTRHRSLAAAERCCARDHAGCKSQGGYSDRYPTEIEVEATPPARVVRVSAHQTGQSFGVVGHVVARNGRTLWRGPVRPYGNDRAALDDALAEVERRPEWTLAPAR